MSRVRSRLLTAVGIGACLLLFSSPATAQQIGGTVRDTTGAVLPGVTVEAQSPSLIERVRSATTDGNGQYLIVALEPGIYAVRYRLPGFSSVLREGVTLSTGFTATINIELALGSVEETVTVTGASPIVDVQNVEKRTTFDRDIVETIPTGKSFQSYALLVPGMNSGGGATYGTSLTQDSGGLTSQIWQRVAIHGSTADDMQTEVNGMDVGDTGIQGANLAAMPDTNFEEIVVEFSGNSAATETGGVRINMIPKEGGNRLTGSSFSTFTSRGLHADNVDQDLRDRGLKSGTLVDKNYTVNVSLGGPIVRDRLWFFGAHTTQRANLQAANVFPAKDPTAFVWDPDLSRPALDRTLVREQTINLTFQANSKDKVKFLWSNSSTDRPNYLQGTALITSFNSPEASAEQAIRTNAYQVTWVRPHTSRLLFEAGVSHLPVVFRLGFSEEADPYIPGILDSPDQIGFRNAGGVFGWTHRYRFYTNDGFRGSMSYVTGRHNVKVGFTTTSLDESVENKSFTWTDYNTLNGQPFQVRFRMPNFTKVFAGPNLGIYAQEQWTRDRLTVNAGVRFDYFKTGYHDQVRAVAVWNPVEDFVPGMTATAWKDLQPRLGAVYDLRGNGKTALKASVGRHGERSATDWAMALNPINNNITQTRSWRDLNGDRIVQGDPFNFAPNGELFSANTNPAWGTPVRTDFFDPAWAFGWGNRPGNWEMSASIQHEVVPRVSVDVGYFRRTFFNQSVVDDRAVVAADYDEFSVTVPTDPRLPGGGGYAVTTVDINPGSVRVPDRLRTSAGNFGGQSQVWNGFDVTADARLKGVLLRGGFSTGSGSLGYCALQTELPEALSTINLRGAQISARDYCQSSSNWLTDVKLIGSYTFPYEIQVAATFQSQPGPERGARVTFRNADIQPSLGRLHSTGGVSINVIEPGTVYGERYNQVDFRLTKILPLGGTARLRAMLDIFNMFNSNAVTREEYGYGVNYLRPLVIQPGRLAKFALQLDF